MTIEISDQTKVFDFPQGRSHFVAVGIPRTSAERKLEVRTWHHGQLKTDEQIFCPVVTLLNGNKRVIDTIELKAMNFTRAGLIDNARFTQVLSLPNDAEYAVLHTLSVSIGQELTARVDRQSTVIVLPSGAYVSRGNDSVNIRCGQQGKVTLHLQ